MEQKKGNDKDLGCIRNCSNGRPQTLNYPPNFQGEIIRKGKKGNELFVALKSDPD